MTRILSAAPLCTPHAPVLDFLDAAAASSFSHVGIRLKEPQPSSALHKIMQTPETRRSLVRRVKDLGLKVLEVEAFWINEDFDIDVFKTCMEVAEQLTPHVFLVVGNDTDGGRLLDNFCRVVELGNSAGMRTGIEFIPYTAVKTLHEAQALIDASGTDAGHVVDTLHLSRSGGSPGDIKCVPEGDVCMFHICDAPARSPETDAEKRTEARSNRLAPGTGELPLREIIDMAPADTPLEVECPMRVFEDLPPREILARLRKAVIDCMEGPRWAAGVKHD